MGYPYMASDLDGTIVKPEDFEVMNETIEDINHYQNVSKNKFFIVTGRAFPMMKKYIHELNVKLPVIASNGASIVDPNTGEVLFAKTLQNDQVAKLLEFGFNNNIDTTVYTSTEIIGVEEGERITTFKELSDNWKEEYRPDFVLFKDLNELKEKILSNKYGVVKVLFSLPATSSDEEKNKVISVLDEMKWYHPTTVIGDRFLIDATEPGTTKATGLADWAKIMNVNVEEIFTFGDNNNDVEMTKQSNFGVVVGNGVPAAQEVAWKVIEPMRENGVGKFLQGIIAHG